MRLAQVKERFKHEGYAITVGLFLTKCLESLSERQWYFRTRIIGLQVRSFLSAAIYKKQLRLSNAAKTSHSPGEITNYVTVDAYRIEPIRLIPELGTVFIETKVSFTRIVKFLEAPELQNRHIKQKCDTNEELKQSILINSAQISSDASSLKPTLTNINLVVQFGEKIAVCGEVGSGKSTLIATILGEVPTINGIVQVHGRIAYVSQTAWIQTGTIQENILFGSNMDQHRYQEVLEKCSLIKDLELLPFGDCTIIGERGVNLSGGRKQRVQLARALYKDAYLLDDPFSAVDAHTATSLFNVITILV
ncbi:ABC transporter C family member 10 [Camellia lanceoleosa]|uniref:ABC transporter C family member 10 n=1 Tax=Camellia lanceoleosa TaxID=1840588 RepID=A0ACC0FLJ8_9ERIC|nr:ABC transporter C family member 10 [Camellia lanceoleosa]